MLLYLVFIIAICFITFANSLFFDFVWDDVHQIKYNPSVRNFRNIFDFFLQPIPEMPLYYRPMFMLSILIDYKIWGNNPFGFHLTNILINIFNNILVFIIAERLFKSRTVAFIASIVFAVHPTHSATVSYVSARNELLCGFFLLHSFSFYTRFRFEKDKKIFLFLSLFFYFLGLLSKEMAITMPFLVILYEYTFHREEIKKHIKTTLFFIITSLIYFFIRLAIVESAENEYPIIWRLATFSKVILYDIFLLFFPFFHKAFYRVEIFQRFSDWYSIIYLIGFLTILFIVFSLRKYDRRLFFSFMWIIVTLIPVTTIVTLIYPALIAERYLYIPSFGLAMFIGILYADIYRAISAYNRTRALIAKAFFIIVTIVFLALTLERNLEYKDDLTLWKTSEENEPYEPYVMDKLATAYMERKYYSQAEIELKRLEVADSQNPQIHHKLGNLYKRWGKYKLAESKYFQALKLDPYYYLALNDLADLYLRIGDLDKALAIFYRSLEINPNEPNVLYEIGEIFLRKNDLINAENTFKNVLAYNPDYYKAYAKLGDIYAMVGNFKLAKEMYEKALSLDTDNDEYRIKLQKLGGK
ncbi:MAG: tetratricopeptide repeat protein [Proteobacteria bacterium]|nr:tetratricopeptide repeat protein [Pseudomonadota bacterium]